ncbi:uncharacterized protein [Aegilops tauschii subsp. strangulata]|uniref:uncharacterized protein isoform X2 n=1 Tax=Aegilops tauschii subsp. strangulata TaxID=200361 RepID=UPI001ABD397C|nr:uncharacterized protein LOC120966681 isoform X4 [Aegilops tauschii subsp. strangulata]
MDSLMPPPAPQPWNTEDDCLPPNNALCRHDEGQHVQNCDWISTMPDDILIEILSLMTISEAAMTGFLSTRWRHVWKKIDHLILDSYAFGMQELEKSRNHENPLLWNDVATKFVNKVNGLLHSRYASTEKLFLDLDNKCCKEGCMICAKGIPCVAACYKVCWFDNSYIDSHETLERGHFLSGLSPQISCFNRIFWSTWLLQASTTYSVEHPMARGFYTFKTLHYYNWWV